VNLQANQLPQAPFRFSISSLSFSVFFFARYAAPLEILALTGNMPLRCLGTLIGQTYREFRLNGRERTRVLVDIGSGQWLVVFRSRRLSHGRRPILARKSVLQEVIKGEVYVEVNTPLPVFVHRSSHG